MLSRNSLYFSSANATAATLTVWFDNDTTRPGVVYTANGTALIGLMPGEYIVEFITPGGYTQTTANVGADGTDSDAGTGGFTACYNLESGETDTASTPVSTRAPRSATASGKTRTPTASRMPARTASPAPPCASTPA